MAYGIFKAAVLISLLVSQCPVQSAPTTETDHHSHEEERNTRQVNYNVSAEAMDAFTGLWTTTIYVSCVLGDRYNSVG